jgi:leucyl/phenylalanyl-tRNA--protein transferase
MSRAYQRLHEQHWAHSIEVWSPTGLVGGLYGLAIGRMFFGESMYSRESNASKAALFALCHVLHENNFLLFDCQVESPHVMTQGATLIPRQQFAEQLKLACNPGAPFTDWPEEAMIISDLVRGKLPDALQ